jgi:crossover junction endodeoxyribonuclease RusA
VKLTLPYPPTGNHAVKHGRFGHYLTAKAKKYRADVAVLVRQQFPGPPLGCAIRVVAEISPPDRRRRDMDNVWKTLADAMTHARAWMDDFQIADLRLVRTAPVKGGTVTIVVEVIE